eukprot:TRINITY_DN4976_c0_g1_i1.p1 TRINITY_DN4976_c0_g1~~TRINITY_DN4976_c0_g1_i1.p1  ORF type:complete len:231 (+),score=52.19 TRINITY_DN4976_c0_g1_i1:220-912(+)
MSKNNKQPSKKGENAQESNINEEEKEEVENQNEGSANDSLAQPDPNNFSVKHPLQNKWTMWWDSRVHKTNQDNWSNNLKPLLEFDTVEDFWRLYNNILPATELTPGSNYHLFKTGIRPEWEDHANEKGGKWVINFRGRATVDECWLNTLLLCIGEGFGEHEDEICGVVISLRRGGDRLALWTRNAENEQGTVEVGKIFKQNVSNNANKIGYQRHEDAMTSRSKENNYYEV